VGGDSAGGNLAALVAVRAAVEGGPALALQLLVYPATDLAGGHPSMDENGEGYFLTRDRMAWFGGHYVPDGVDLADPSLSPLYVPAETLARVAPAHVIVAGYDPLRDEGRAFAEKLMTAGVYTELAEYPTMIHGFFQMAGITPVAVEAAERAATALRRAFQAA
jgi:acetyl esterase